MRPARGAMYAAAVLLFFAEQMTVAADVLLTRRPVPELQEWTDGT